MFGIVVTIVIFATIIALRTMSLVKIINKENYNTNSEGE